MEIGNNVYKYFSDGEWRSELQGSNAKSPGSGPKADSPRPRFELPSISESSQLDHRVSSCSGLTAVNPISMELEGSVPMRQTQPLIEETGEDVQEDLLVSDIEIHVKARPILSATSYPGD